MGLLVSRVVYKEEVVMTQKLTEVVLSELAPNPFRDIDTYPFDEEKITRLSQYLGLANAGVDGFISWVLELRSQLGIPHRLADIGIDDEDSEKVGAMAVDDPSAGGNPIAFSAAEYQGIFRNAVNGQL